MTQMPFVLQRDEVAPGHVQRLERTGAVRARAPPGQRLRPLDHFTVYPRPSMQTANAF